MLACVTQPVNRGRLHSLEGDMGRVGGGQGTRPKYMGDRGINLLRSIWTEELEKGSSGFSKRELLQRAANMTLALRDGVSEGPRINLPPTPFFTSISGFSVNQQR